MTKEKFLTSRKSEFCVVAIAIFGVLLTSLAFAGLMFPMCSDILECFSKELPDYVSELVIGVFAFVSNNYLIFALLSGIFAFLFLLIERKRKTVQFAFSNVKNRFGDRFAEIDYNDSDIRKIKDLSDATSEKSYASIFATAVLTPQCLFGYIDEHVEPFTRSVNVTTNAEIKIPYAMKNKAFCLPLFMYQRGDVPSALKIKAASGAIISRLNFQESVEYILSVLKCYCPLIKSDKTLECDIRTYLNFEEAINSSDNISQRIEEALRLVLKCYCPLIKSDKTLECNIGTYLSSGKNKIRDINQRIEKARDLINQSMQLLSDRTEVEQNVEIVKQLLIKLARSYPICIRCIGVDAPKKNKIQKNYPLSYISQRSRSFSLSFSYRLPLVRVLAEEKSNLQHKFLNWIVRRPMTIFYDLENADRTQSYHLQMKGPKHTYYSYGRLQKISESGPMAEADMFGVSKRRGQRHARLAIQNGSGFSNLSFFFAYTPRGFSFNHIALFVLATEFIVSLMHLSTTANRENFAVTVTVTIMASLAAVVSAWTTDQVNAGREIELAPKLSSWLAIVVTIVLALSICASGVVRDGLIAALFVLTCFLAAGFIWLFLEIFSRRMQYLTAKKENVIADVMSDSNTNTSYIRWSPGWRAKSSYYCEKVLTEIENENDIDSKFSKNSNYVRDELLGI